MRLYGNRNSACTRSVLMVLAEKGVSVDFVDLDLSKGENRSESHLMLNPFGKIPVLEDDSMTLYESQGINRYLDAILPGIQLTPSDVRCRARMDQWLCIDSSYFMPQAFNVVLQKIFLPMMGGETDHAVVGAAEENLKVVYRAMDAALEHSTYLAGEQVSLADLAFVQYTDFLLQAKCENLIFGHEIVRRWWHLMAQRESYKNPLQTIN